MIITKRLLELVAELAAKERQNDIPECAMRVAPGCDALVWRIWPKDGSEL